MFSVTGEMIDSDNEKTTRLCVNQFVYAFTGWLKPSRLMALML